MTLHRRSPAKVNFVLNILGRRPDGFHDLETLFFPVPLHDELMFVRREEPGVQLTCNRADLPVDGSNLVRRAADVFFAAARLGPEVGVHIHLDKHLPLAAGLGAGSANAAVTLKALNDLYGRPLSVDELDPLAAGLGSDVNFFLQPHPALATGRGERIEPLAPFTALQGWALVLFHPGFGVPTPWAFRELARFPQHQNGTPGRAVEVARRFAAGDISGGVAGWYNALEAPVLEKYPILALHQEFWRSRGAHGALMSGSGSTTFALFESPGAAEASVPEFRAEFGETGWLAVAPL